MTFTERLNKEGPILLDGGLATELERMGEDLSHPLWSGRVLIDAPERIIDVHKQFADAGCEILTTATYQLSIPGLVKIGNTEQVAERKLHELLSKGVELSRVAIDDKSIFIAGSMGPYGAYLADGSEFTGDYSLSSEKLKEFHRPRVSFFEKHDDVNILAFETIPSLEEAMAIAELLDEMNTKTPAWISFSCKNESETCKGDSVSECAKIFDQFNRVTLLGVNCTQPEFVESLLKEFHAETKKPLVAYPNSGEVWNPKTRSWEGPSKTDLPSSADRWIRNGAKIIGGCCRVGPQICAQLHPNKP